MKKILKVFDYVFVLRPTLFFAVWTIFLAGFFVQQKFASAATSVNANHTSALPMLSLDQLSAGLFLTLLMGSVFILNQIMDRHSDNQNNKLFLIADGHVTPKAAFIEASVLAGAALVSGFLISYKAEFNRNMGLWFLALFLLSGIVYSFRPFSWKDKPILGLVANIAGAILIFTCGWILRGQPSIQLLIHATPYMLAVAGVYLYTTLPDMEGDASAEKRTFAVKYGFKATIYLGLLMELGALVSATILEDEVIFYPAFFSILFYIWASVKLRPEDVMRAIKYPVMTLALTVAIKYKVELGSLLYFYVLAGVYFVSKVYYRLRFGVDYPSLSVNEG